MPHADAGSMHFVDLFAKQVADHPDRIAVDAGPASSATYVELDNWSEALARDLPPADAPIASPVVVMCGHDSRAAASFVAIAKVGRPAVFLDTTTPTARMRQILSLAQPVATMVAADQLERARELADLAGTLITVTEPLAAPPRERLSTDHLDEARAITIVFTSGSTGVPKGVIVGDAALCEEMSNAVLGDVVCRRVGCPQPMSFIAGTGALLRSLLIGARLYLYDPRRDGIAGMVDWVVQNEITDLNLTPHLMRSLARAALDRGTVFDSVEMVLCGGEAMLVPDAEAMRRCTTDRCVILNGSGSSEGWGVSYLIIDRSYQLPAYGQVPAGRAFDNRELYLLDDRGYRITEPGTTGMIMVAAKNMALGYLNNPTLTAERFSVDERGRRVYRTGDLGRWNDAGELEYAGRADHMLKIRGYLVEPAEIEGQLMAAGEVAECVVVGRPGRQPGVTQLVGYVVPDPTRWVSASALRRRLAGALPNYMVPQVFVELPALPRNPNGKIDRLNLPDAPSDPVDTSPEAWTSIELVIASICTGALGLDKIGRDDDLFALGADSLAVEEIISALESELGISVTSASLLQHSTIAELTALPRHAGKPEHGVIVELASGGLGTPVFLFAGSAGLGLQFRELARELGAERPVYGVQAHGLEGPGLPDVTIRAAARRFTRAIRAVQPHGPYRLAGHSLGSIIAYEVARRLAAAGEPIAYLGLLDPMSGDDAYSAQRLERIKPDAVPARPPAARQHGRRTLTGLRERVGYERPFLTRTFWRNRKSRPFIAYWHLGVSMAYRYRPPAAPLAGIASVVYVAADEPGNRAPDWSDLLTPAPGMRPVDGDHLSMLHAPFVIGLAKAMSADLA